MLLWGGIGGGTFTYDWKNQMRPYHRNIIAIDYYCQGSLMLLSEKDLLPYLFQKWNPG